MQIDYQMCKCQASSKIQGDQEVSVHLMITIQLSGAQILFDHPVVFIN